MCNSNVILHDLWQGLATSDREGGRPAQAGGLSLEATKDFGVGGAVVAISLIGKPCDIALAKRLKPKLRSD
jgi:hypothetical protein